MPRLSGGLRWCKGVLLFFLAASLQAESQELAASRFTSGTEGWVVINWDGSGTPVTPSWQATGGNPGGYIRSTDVQGDGFWKAPASWHGNWSTAYGGTLSYDVVSIAGDWVMTDIYLAGNGLTLSFRFNTNPPPQWKTYSVKLDATAGWQFGMLYTETGPLATEQQIRSVLANVTDLRIREEYVWGADDSGLDNVVLTSPGPILQAISTQQNQVQIILRNLQTNLSYQLEQKTTPVAPETWKPTLSFTATNNVQTFTLPITNRVQFYRAHSP
jgi:hypothetical protein